MRLAHLADPHLGFRQFHRQTAAGINQREVDVGRSFRAAIDGVIAAAPDAVVIAGDLFHTVRPPNAAIVFAFNQFQRLREALPNTPVVLIAGNHDTPRSVETGSILRLFSEVGIEVATSDARRVEFAELDLSVLAVPHQALMAEARPVLRPSGSHRYQVLILHGEVAGVLPTDPGLVEHGGAVVVPGELKSAGWSYVALGHYHVRHEVAPRIWYSGALDYVSSNIWGERADERRRGVDGKGWLLVDLDSGAVEARSVPNTRSIDDLKPVDAANRTPEEVDGLIAAALRELPGGGSLDDRIVRLVVNNIPRHVVRDLDHAALRTAKAKALHLHLDFRRPEPTRRTGVGAPGRRQALPELVAAWLRERPLPAGIDREEFIKLGVSLLEVEG